MARITKVEAKGTRFGQHGDHYVNIVVQCDADKEALRWVQYYPQWARDLQHDRTHRVHISRGYDSDAVILTYHPEIVYAYRNFARWSLRKLGDLKALAMKYAVELEAEAKRIEPQAKKAAELRVMAQALGFEAHVTLYTDGDGTTVDIEMHARANYEHGRELTEPVWRAPAGFNPRYRLPLDDPYVYRYTEGRAEASLTVEEFLRFDETQFRNLHQLAIDSLNRDALRKCVHIMANRVSTQQVSVTAATEHPFGLTVWFDGVGEPKWKELRTLEETLDYLESHDAEAIKRDLGYQAPSPSARSAAERTERVQRVAASKALADAKAKLEAEWKAILDAIDAPESVAVDAWHEESEE